MTLIGDLEKFNPWWKTGEIKDSWLKPYKRHIYSDIEKYTDKRQGIHIHFKLKGNLTNYWTGFTGSTGYETKLISCKSCKSGQNIILFKVDT